MPSPHPWLYHSLYAGLRAEGLHLRLGEAAARLLFDPDLGARQAAAYLLRAASDDPSVPGALRTALAGDRALFRGHPAAFGDPPGGLEGELVSALANSMAADDAWAIGVLRDAVVRPDMAGAALAGLEAFAPQVLVSHATRIAGASPRFLPTLLALLAPGRASGRTRIVAPLCDVVARLARDGTPPETLRAALPQLGRAQPSVDRIIEAPRDIGQYDDAEVEDEESALYAAARTAAACNGAVLFALSRRDPGFLQRRLSTILELTPGVLGSLLYALALDQVDLPGLGRRIVAAGIAPSTLRDVAEAALSDAEAAAVCGPAA